MGDDLLPSLTYLCLAYIFTAITIPVCHILFKHSKISWYFSSRALGILTINYLIWILSHNAFGWSFSNIESNHNFLIRLIKFFLGNGLGVLPYSRLSLYIILLILMFFSAWGYKCFGKEICSRVKKEHRTILVGEITFLIAFLFCTCLRIYSHGIEGQEKFMDMAFLTSHIYTSALPTPDPWLWKGVINYYYGGYMLLGTFAKMAGVPPEIAYNLSVSLIFSMACMLVFSLVYELIHKIKWAVLSIFTVLLMGNLDVIIQNWEYWKNTNSLKTFHLDWWRVSRIIHDGPIGNENFATINEFPFFTYFHADLHPHLINIPFVLLFLILIVNLLKTPRNKLIKIYNKKVLTLFPPLSLFFSALVLGNLAMINGFDFIFFVPFLFLVLFINEIYLTKNILSGLSISIFKGFSILISALFLFAPFFLNYKTPIKSAQINSSTSSIGQFMSKLPFGISDFHTDIGEFIIIWGTHLVIILPFLFPVILFLRKKIPDTLVFGSITALLIIVFAFLGSAVTTLLFFMIILLIISLFLVSRDVKGQFITSSLLMVLCVLLLCEFFYIRDSYGFGLQRMNTLFKFYFPCWILLGICLPYCILEIFKNNLITRKYKTIIIGFGTLLFLWAMEYPLIVSYNRISHEYSAREDKSDLDGMNYLLKNHPGDYKAIMWLRKNTTPNESILEAIGDSYTYYSRISTFTGLRTLLGWQGHESLWRGVSFSHLKDVANSIYSKTNFDEILPLLNKYEIKYIYVGELEHENYSEESFMKFESNLTKIYSDPGNNVSIYSTGL